MDSWFSPFALPPEVKDLLDRSNLRRIRGEQTEADDRRLLLVYRARRRFSITGREPTDCCALLNFRKL